METLLDDLRYAVRRIARAPGFTSVAVLSLALGIGANTAAFSLVDAVLLRELPLERPEELVEVYASNPGFETAPLSYPDMLDVREATGEVFAGVGAARLTLAQVDVEGGVEMLPAELVTGNWFPLLGIDAAVGRTLLPEDDVAPGAHPVVALGHAYWERAWGADPSVVGRELRIAGRPYTVVGVVEAGYTGVLRGLQPDLFFPTMMIDAFDGAGPGSTSQLESRGSQSFFAKARLAPGVATPEARAALDRLAERLRAEHPQVWTPDDGFRLTPTADVVINPMMDRVLVPAFGLLLVVVAIVLLIACANLASFLLARAADRRREIAVRLALGARRGGLVRQLLTETVLLALLGGALGLAVASWGLRALMAADLPFPVPVTLDVGVNGTVLGFTALVSVGAGVLFGLAPALQATNPDVAPTLKNETTGGGRPRRVSLRNGLVAGQVALSVVLLVGAGLLLRSLVARQDVNPGFGAEPAALVSLSLPGDEYDAERGRLFYDELESRLEAMPAVGEVGYTTNVHLNTLNTTRARVTVDGVAPPPGQDFFLIDRAEVDGDFFRAAGIELVDGRLFGPDDGGEDREAVVVVNRAFAERFWPGGSAVGRSVRVRDEEAAVVGVVETARIRSLGEDPTPFLYEGGDRAIDGYATVVATTRGDASAAAAEVVAAARALAPGVRVYEATTMERHLAVMTLPHRLSAMAAGLFAVLALTLAAIGLYGVVGYAVSSRAREVGIRMSLGAEPARVVRLLMGGGMRVVAVGVAVGLALAFVFGGILDRFLFGVAGTDPVTFVGVPALLLAVAGLAAWIPARRAARVDPVRALKAE